jgi:translation initiation factor 1
MGKKPPAKAGVPLGQSSPLQHSPFAALGPREPPDAEAAPAGSVRAEAAPQPPAAKPRGRLVLRRETKRRGGKAVVVVSGFASTAIDAAALERLAKEIKTALGCGGALEAVGEERELVLQGDQPARVADLLRERGFRVGGVTS